MTIPSTINVTVQMAAPRAVGRCLALYQMHAFGGLAVGSFARGNLAERIGVHGAILLSAIRLCVSLLPAIPLPLPGVVSPEVEEALA